MKPPLKISLLKGMQNVIEETWQKFFNKVAVLDEDNTFEGDNTFSGDNAHSGTETFTVAVAGSAFDGSGDIVPTSGSGWTSGTGCFYHKTFDGYVTVHVYCTGSGTDTDATVLFTLPAGYRPTNPYHAPLIAAVGGSFSTAGLLYILSNGDATIYGVGGKSPSLLAGLAVYKAA